ncbi:MAG TPA: 4'-phosphopantetheinyl transferase superfamily protein [Longimicrobiales bacterium]|nr:4'-phosphopantetheinyl transferase superfamily protein [Longimicrobiales bacterium]
MSAVCVGNDIVDLANPRTEGRSADERFVARVLSADEREVVRTSAEPDLELWCHWAAKEAGYKVISKLVGEPPPFVHRAFEVAWTDAARAATTGSADASGPADAPVVRRGAVRWREHRAHVWVALHAGGVHAVAHASRETAGRSVCVRPHVALLDAPESAWAGTLEELMPLFSEREADAVYSLASAAVRVGAREQLAALLGVPERRLEIVCAPGPTSQRPPRVLLDGRETEADVSLSHDGPLIAWALWVGQDPAVPSRNSIGSDTESST